MSVQTYIDSSTEAQLLLLRKQSDTQKYVGMAIQFLMDLLPLAFRIGLFALVLFSLSTSFDFGIMTGGGEGALKWGGIFFVCAFLNVTLFKLRGQANRTANTRAAINAMIAPLLALDMLAVFGCTIGVNPPEMFTIGLAAIESRQVDIDYAKKKLSEAKKHSRYKAKPEGVLTVQAAESKKEHAVNAMVLERTRLKSEGIEVIKPNEVMYHVMAYATPLTPLMLQFINKLLFALCVIYICIVGSKYSDQLKIIMDEVRTAARLRLRAINKDRSTKTKADLSAAFAGLERVKPVPSGSHIAPVIMEIGEPGPVSKIALPHNFSFMYEAARKFVLEGGKPSVRSIQLVMYKGDDMDHAKMIKAHAELVHKALDENDIIKKKGDSANSHFILFDAA